MCDWYKNAPDLLEIYIKKKKMLLVLFDAAQTEINSYLAMQRLAGLQQTK